MKVDRFELENQRRKEAIEIGKYARCEIIVPEGSLAPIVTIESYKVCKGEMAVLLSALNDTYKKIAEMYPNAKAISENYLKTCTSEIARKGDKLVDIDENKD